MGEETKIEWCDHTFNCWIGCQKVSAGCDNCYAETMMDHRYHKVQWGPHGERKRTSVQYWKQPLKWAKDERQRRWQLQHGKDTEGWGAWKRPRVFCASLADVFDNQAPPGARADLFNLIRQTPELDWLLLTKRPENIRAMLPDAQSWRDGWPNVWLGTTCENQETYRKRYSILSEIPAAVRFISYEPALGPLTINLAVPPVLKPDWIICGGESGKGARPMELWWARKVRDDCAKYDISFFMKQITDSRGHKLPIWEWPHDLSVRQFPR